MVLQRLPREHARILTKKSILLSSLYLAVCSNRDVILASFLQRKKDYHLCR